MDSSGDSNNSDTGENDSTALSSSLTPPETSRIPCSSNNTNQLPTATSEARSSQPKSPPLLPSWCKSPTPMLTPETAPGMIIPATVLQRLFNNPLYSDLVLIVNGTAFHVHRGILAEQCSYFRLLFEDARSLDPTTKIKKIDCSYKQISYEQTSKERDLVEKLGEGEGEVEASIAAVHEPSGPTRTASLRTGKFRSQNAIDEDEREFDADAEDEAHDHLVATKTAVAPRSEPRVPKTTQSSAPKTSSTPSKSISAHHPQHSQKDIHLEPFPNLRSNTNHAILTTGYTAQHFALFLQILYGIQPITTLKDTDLLPVFRIAHVYEPGWLVSLLGAQIFQRLTFSVETWVPILQFAERYQLDTIRQRTIEYASQHRSLWTLAVETLALEDFKAFLRGIHQHDTTSGGSVKDELLLMFLLVHYQDTTTFSASALASLNPMSSASLTTVNQQSRQQAALFRRLSRSYSRKQRAVNGSSSVLKIRQQLLGTLVGSAPHAESLASQESDQLECRGDNVGTSSYDKAGKAKLWMRRFKMECGWEGKISALD